MTYLRSLYLNENVLSGPIPQEIGNMTLLSYLYLNDNFLRGIIPDEICNHLLYTSPGLSGNQLCPYHPTSDLF